MGGNNKRMLFIPAALAVACSVSVGACLASFAMPASAAGLEVEVEFGFSGHYYPGVPTPIAILLENQGPPIRGQLLIYQEVRSPWRGVFEERLTLPVELSRGAKRLFQLNFPIHGHIYPLRIQLRGEGEEGLIYQGKIDFRRRYHEERLCLFLSDPDPGAGVPFRGQGGELPTGERPIWVEPGLLPSEWAGYLGVRRIYLGRLNPFALTERQWEAITRWVRWGGELVILSGESWYYHQENPFLGELLPRLLEDPEVADREGQLIVLGEPRGEVLHRTEEGLPLLIAARWGRGRVLLSTVDPLESSPGEGFWRELKVEVEVGSPPGEIGGVSLGRLELARELFGEQELPYPGRLPLIGLYLAFLGGLILLRAFVRPRRRGRRWGQQRQVLLLLLWSGGVTLLGSLYLSGSQGGGPLLALELGLVHDMGELSLSSTWWGLFAKKALPLELPLADEGGGYLIQLVPEERGEHLYDLFRLQDRDGRVRLSFRVERQMGRYFWGERFTPDLVSFTISSIEEDGLLLRAANVSAELLHDCALRGRGRFHPLGDLPPGEPVEAKLELADGSLPTYEEPPWLKGALKRLYRLALREVEEPFLVCWANFREVELPGGEGEALKLILIEPDSDSGRIDHVGGMHDG